MCTGKKIQTLLAAVLLGALVWGCSWQYEEEPSRERTEDLIVVGVSQVGSESVWRTANTASIQQVFSRENGYFLMFDNARQKQENQIRAIRRFISQRVDYIVFSPIVEEGWETVLEEAKEADIPVILMDRMADIPPYLYTAWVGSDFEAEGRKAGEWLEGYLKGTRFNQDQINIVVLQEQKDPRRCLEGPKDLSRLQMNMIIGSFWNRWTPILLRQRERKKWPG